MCIIGVAWSEEALLATLYVKMISCVNISIDTRAVWAKETRVLSKPLVELTKA